MLSNCKSQHGLWHSVCGKNPSYTWLPCLLCTTCSFLRCCAIRKQVKSPFACTALPSPDAEGKEKYLQVSRLGVGRCLGRRTSNTRMCDLLFLNSCSKCCCYSSWVGSEFPTLASAGLRAKMYFCPIPPSVPFSVSPNYIFDVILPSQLIFMLLALDFLFFFFFQ